VTRRQTALMAALRVCLSFPPPACVDCGNAAAPNGVGHSPDFPAHINWECRTCGVVFNIRHETVSMVTAWLECPCDEHYTAAEEELPRTLRGAGCA